VTILATIFGTLVLCGGHDSGNYYTGREIVLNDALCAPLRAAPRPREMTDMAVFVLAHELGHASGLPAEDDADCYAAGSMVRVALALGFPRRTALRFRRSARAAGWGYRRVPARCWR
jgi:hypothetical protein